VHHEHRCAFAPDPRQLRRGRQLAVLPVAAEVARQQDGIDLAARQERSRHARVRRDVSLATAREVDRIGCRGSRRKHGGEFGREALRERRQLEPE
jgi:hypothetical protein